MSKLNLNKLESRYFEGTCCATASSPAAKKKTIPRSWMGEKVQPMLSGSAAVYFNNGAISRDGLNVTTTAQAFEPGDTDTPKTIFLNDALGVVIYLDAGDSSKLKGVAFTIDESGTVNPGAVTVLNNEATTDISICKVDTKTFAIAYCDDGGNDYLAANICTVSGTTITVGIQAFLVSAAVKKTYKTGICIPRSGVVFVAYGLNSDTYGYGVASTFTGTTIATAGSPVAFNSAASSYIACCSHYLGYVTCVYNDAGHSSYMYYNIGTVSAAGVVAFGGSAGAITSAAATYIQIKSPTANSVVISYLASAHTTLIAGTISSTTLTCGSLAAVDAVTDLTPSFDMWDDKNGIVIAEDSSTTYLKGSHFSVNWSTSAITVDTYFDYLTEANSVDCRISLKTNGTGIFVYDNAAASDAGTINYVKYYDNSTGAVVDIRSATASATYKMRLFPIIEYEPTY